MTDTPRDWADEKARDIVHSCNTKGMTLAQLTEFGTTIAQSLRAARRVPEGHLRTDDGAEYKISASWGCRASNMAFEATRTAAEAAKGGG